MHGCVMIFLAGGAAFPFPLREMRLNTTYLHYVCCLNWCLLLAPADKLWRLRRWGQSWGLRKSVHNRRVAGQRYALNKGVLPQNNRRCPRTESLP